MTLRQCPWLQARPWDQSFRLFTSIDDSIVLANRTFSARELPPTIHSGIDRGPESLLQLLPQPTRKIVGKLLDLNPKSRATIEDLRFDDWYSGISGCQSEGYTEDSEYQSFHLSASGVERMQRLGFGYATHLRSSKNSEI